MKNWDVVPLEEWPAQDHVLSGNWQTCAPTGTLDYRQGAQVTDRPAFAPSSPNRRPMLPLTFIEGWTLGGLFIEGATLGGLFIFIPR